MNETLPPTVCLDGNRIRRIREEQNFTQLYVAKVVGVTTDTISRWENNRYPSVKRQNALLLAQALETDMGNILRSEEPADEENTPLQADSPTGEPATAPKEKRGVSPGVIRLFLFGVILFSVGVFLYKLTASNPDQPFFEVQATRHLTSYAAPGAKVPVRIRLQTEGTFRGFILKESFPPGWKLVQANPPPSSLDNENGMVRWIIRPGQIPPLISYVLNVPPKAVFDSRATFSGRVTVTGGGREEVTGEAKLDVLDRHWADSDGDLTIDDVEVLKAYEAIEEMSGVHLDWDTIVGIWDAGAYTYDPSSGTFHPTRPGDNGIPDGSLQDGVQSGPAQTARVISCL